MPKVSVLTPIYNTNIQFLKEMIESVLSQTFRDFEFLILNDSPANAELERVVGEYQTKDSRIRYLKNEVNLGITGSRNRLFDEAKGEYLAILDHDDVCAPERFAEQAAYLDANPEVGVVGTYASKIGPGRPLHFPVENMDLKRAMMHVCVISHSSSMLRKSVMEAHGIRWEAEYSPCEDYMLWARLMKWTMFHNIPRELLKWRVYEQSSGASSAKLMDDRAAMVRSFLRREYPDFLNASKEYRLFGCVPILTKKVRAGNDVRYFLLGKIPLLRISDK